MKREFNPAVERAGRISRPAAHLIDIRLIQTETETIYSYQLLTDHVILRWDNAPHFPSIPTFPHHYHNVDGMVEPYSLTGAILEDLNAVLEAIETILVSAGATD